MNWKCLRLRRDADVLFISGFRLKRREQAANYGALGEPGAPGGRIRLPVISWCSSWRRDDGKQAKTWRRRHPSEDRWPREMWNISSSPPPPPHSHSPTHSNQLVCHSAVNGCSFKDEILTPGDGRANQLSSPRVVVGLPPGPGAGVGSPSWTLVEQPHIDGAPTLARCL